MILAKSAVNPQLLVRPRAIDFVAWPVKLILVINMFNQNDTTLRSLNADSINHYASDIIAGVTNCWCGKRSTYKAASGYVYCCKNHELIKEK